MKQLELEGFSEASSASELEVEIFGEEFFSEMSGGPVAGATETVYHTSTYIKGPWADDEDDQLD